MKNTDIEFKNGRVSLSEETYSELRQFCLQHGETDLPPVPLFAATAEARAEGGPIKSGTPYLVGGSEEQVEVRLPRKPKTD